MNKLVNREIHDITMIGKHIDWIETYSKQTDIPQTRIFDRIISLGIDNINDIEIEPGKMANTIRKGTDFRPEHWRWLRNYRNSTGIPSSKVICAFINFYINRLEKGAIKMRTISMMNAKGGVGKTVSTVNFAAVLAIKHKKRVLVVDADSQADATCAFCKDDSDDFKTLSDIFEDKAVLAKDVIQRTKYDGIDILPADLSLQRAEKNVLLDVTRPQQTRLRKALKGVESEYDYCLIDCPPSIGMCSINAIVASDDVLVPMKIDKYSMKGLRFITEAIDDFQEFNDSLAFRGCFITQFSNNRLSREGEENLRKMLPGKIFKTHIRQTIRVSESTYTEPLIVSEPKSSAAMDYISLVDEYLNSIL